MEPRRVWLLRRMPNQENLGLGHLCIYNRVCLSIALSVTSHSRLNSGGILLAFMIPRVPGLNINTIAPLQPATGTYNASIPTEFSRAPANFSFPAFASIQVDTTSSYLPLTISHMTAEVFDSATGYQVATSVLAHQTFPAKTFSNLNLPLNFSYVAVNDTDTTCEWTGGRFTVSTLSYNILCRDQLVQCLQE